MYLQESSKAYGGGDFREDLSNNQSKRWGGMYQKDLRSNWT